MLYRAFVTVLGMALFFFQESLKRITVIEVPGPKGQRFDYLAIDGEDHYLLSAHLGPGILYVVDMRTNKLVKASEVNTQVQKAQEPKNKSDMSRRER